MQLKELDCDLESVKQSIIQKKQIEISLQDILSDAVASIYETNMLLYRISQSVSTPYDTNNKEHEDKLLELWNKMMPNTPLESRISKQWVDVSPISLLTHK